MPMITQELFEQWLLLPILLFFFIVGLMGLMVGTGLVAYGTRTFRFFELMNTWVSMRRATKSLDIPRNIAPDIQSYLLRYRRFFAILVVVTAAYSAFVLTMRVDISAFSDLVGRKWNVPSAFVFLVADSARWCLVVGSVLAIVVGAMLEFYPKTLQIIEKNSARWWTPRKLSRRGDEMHFTLDKWVANNAQRAGWIILAISLIEVFSIATLLF